MHWLLLQTSECAEDEVCWGEDPGMLVGDIWVWHVPGLQHSICSHAAQADMPGVELTGDVLSREWASKDVQSRLTPLQGALQLLAVEGPCADLIHGYLAEEDGPYSYGSLYELCCSL